MLSDPKTTPDSRAGRILFPLAVAVGAAWIQFRLFRTNGLLWALVALSPLAPLLDRLLPGRRYAWAFPKGVPHEALAPLPGRLLPGAARPAASGAPVLRVLRGPGRREAL